MYSWKLSKEEFGYLRGAFLNYDFRGNGENTEIEESLERKLDQMDLVIKELVEEVEEVKIALTIDSPTKVSE